ncbi:uncharacterized protein C19orf44 homolog [Eublepharis macularius]|uniref:Uncharacterized protein C19orf44 homolog n=1 Tax=Eublepharis macularius TaxID=481883 RepID=A0AA97JEL9_EUBMA|nr:uncharacterized protein C19orf44 homolog [Eublepharis macularius]
MRRRGEAQARLVEPQEWRPGSSLQEDPNNRLGPALWSSGSRFLSFAQVEAGESESERVPDAALLQPKSRFLKQKPSSSHADQRAGRAELPVAARPTPSSGSQGRAGAVLRKLAQIESKIQKRKARLGTDGSVAQQMLTDGELSWSQSSQDEEQSVGGLRYLKTDAKPKEASVPGPYQNNTVSLGREKEDMRHLIDATGKYKRQKGISQARPGGKPVLNSQLSVPTKTTPPSPSRRSSPPGRSSLKKNFHRTLSPPSRNIPVLSRRTSHSLSSSINDNHAVTASPKADERSLSEGSHIRSLNELFLGTANAQCTSSSSSSSDFQVNVLSLNDLASSMTFQKEGLTEEATVMETSGSLSRELEPELYFDDTQSALKAPGATVGETAALEEDLEGTEISEQLSGNSAEHSTCKQENPSSPAEYSEDFDSLSEDAGRQSFSEDSQDWSGASLQSGLPDPSSCLPQTGTRSPHAARRITVKEAAVQTGTSSLAPHCLKTAAGVDWIAEASLPTHHIVSMDAQQELAAYSPISALNDMLKQNLLLIRQFVEASRRLHLSFVAQLEKEEFHYHTLEEAKMYIDHHKLSPLTLEQPLHKLEDQEPAAV